MAATTDIEVTIERSIGRVPAADWNAIAGGQVFARHGWLRAVEEGVHAGSRPVYILLYERLQLVAGAVAYEIDGPRESHVVDSQFFGRLTQTFARFRLSLCPALLCGPIVGHGRYLFWTPGVSASRRIELLTCLIEQLRAYAESRRHTLVFAKMPVDEHETLSMIEAHTHSVTHALPVSYLDIRWESFDDYLAGLNTLGKNMGNKARRESKAPAKHDVRISRLRDYRESSEEIVGLLRETQGKHTSTPAQYSGNFCALLDRYHRDDTVVTVSESAGHTTGAALLLIGPGNAAGPSIGLSDSECNRKSFTYFNLAIYEPIRFGIENRLDRIYLGASSYELKRRRGCREMPLIILVRCRTIFGSIAMRLWCVIHRRWTRRNLAREGVQDVDLARIETGS